MRSVCILLTSMTSHEIFRFSADINCNNSTEIQWVMSNYIIGISYPVIIDHSFGGIHK